MAAVISVPYTILMDNGIVEGQPETGPYAIVKFKVLTANRYQLVADLVGTSIRSGSTIIRTYPFRYPPSDNLVCRAIESIEQRGPAFPLGVGTYWIGRKWSIVTARFEVAKFFDNTSDPSGKPYTTTTFDQSGEILTLPNGVYKFSGGTPTETPIGLTIPQMAISMKRHMLPYPPVAEVAGLIGKVNLTTVTVGGYSFAPGYLLFLGGPCTIQQDTVGNLMYEVDYRMLYRPILWNNYLHPNGTSGFQPVSDGNGNPVFGSGEFNTLP